jgi:predicted lipoprotein with Yx(FWY)xxD motif
MRLQKRSIAAAAGVLVAVTTLSACGLLSSGSSASNYQTGTSGATSDPPADPTMMPTPSASTMSTTSGGLMEVKSTMLGLILANPHGMTVYWYSVDKKGSGVSSCTGSCAQAWPPVIAPVRLPAGYTLAGPIGYIVRPNGQHQVTVDGYPIYRYAGDKAPGETNGAGVGGVWHVVKVKKSSSGSMGSGSMGSGSSGSGSSGSGSSGSGSGGSGSSGSGSGGSGSGGGW